MEAFDEDNTNFRIDIFDLDRNQKRSINVGQSSFIYTETMELDDFGVPQTQIALAITQYGNDNGQLGVTANKIIAI